MALFLEENDSPCMFLKNVTNQVRLFEANENSTASIISNERVNSRSVRLIVQTRCCGSEFGWILDLHISGADVTPQNIENHITDFYNIFTLSSLPSLQNWTDENEQGIINIVLELSNMFSSHQRHLISTHPNKRVCFNSDIVKGFEGYEGLVSHDSVHLIFPLFPEKVKSDPLNVMKVHATVSSTGSSDGGFADIVLEMPDVWRLSSTVKPLKWDLNISLWDYLPPLQLTIQTAWVKRKELIEALVMAYSVLEYDPIDYSRAFVLLKSKSAGQKLKVTRILEFCLDMNFPDKPPIMTLREFQSSQSWPLDPVLYRYSPRWTAHRMGEELVQHARTVNNQAWVS